MPITVIRRIALTVAAVAVLFGTLGAVSNCTGTPSAGNGDDKPQPAHSTSVGPSGTGRASIIPEDTTVVFPADQDETDYAIAHGATFTCGDGGMSYASLPQACVGHDGVSEVVRR